MICYNCVIDVVISDLNVSPDVVMVDDVANDLVVRVMLCNCGGSIDVCGNDNGCNMS